MKDAVTQTLAEADQYYRSMCGKNGKPSIFPPDIQYNTLGMALEKYLCGFLEAHGTMPNNHTFSDLVDAMDQVKPLPDDLHATLLETERAQFICAFDTPIQDVTQDVADKLRIAVGQVADFVKSELATMDA